MSSEIDCYFYDQFKYCNVNGVFMLGNGTDYPHNALDNNITGPQTLIVPRSVHGMAVQEIGHRALFQCLNIKKIIIEARITVIRNEGISQMKSLEYISLPNTLTRIEDWGIHFYDPELPNYTPNNGSATIVFEPNSRLSYVGNHGISYKETLNIYFCDPVYPVLDPATFFRVTHLHIYSMFQFSLNTTESIVTHIPYCQRCTPFNLIRESRFLQLRTYTYIFIAMTK